MKSLFTIFFLMLSSACFSQNDFHIYSVGKIFSDTDERIKKQDSVNNALILKLDSIKDKLSTLDSLDYSEKYYKSIIDMQDRTIKSISDKLTVSSYILGGIGILFAVGGIALTVHINNIEKKANDVLKKVKKKEEEIEQLKKKIDETSLTVTGTNTNVEDVKVNVEGMLMRVENIDESIKSDIEGLYSKLRREETKYTLNRLLENPEEITAFHNSLISKNLEKEDFETLKNIYLKIGREDVKYIIREILFNQFTYQTIVDDEIGNCFEGYYDLLAKKIKPSLSKEKLEVIIREYIKGVSKIGLIEKKENISEFVRVFELIRNDINTLQIIFQSLENQNEHFIFFSILKDFYDGDWGSYKHSALMYGKNLMDYPLTRLTREQKDIIKEIEYLEEQEKAEQEAFAEYREEKARIDKEESEKS